MAPRVAVVTWRGAMSVYAGGCGVLLRLAREKRSRVEGAREGKALAGRDLPGVARG